MKVASASGSFTCNAKLTTGGGYQYNVSTKGLTICRRIAYALKFRVSADQCPPFDLTGDTQTVLRC